MKKITSIFSVALLLAGTANAQVAELQGYKTVTLGEEVLQASEIVAESQWYAIYQARGNGGYWTDNGEGQELIKSNGTSVLDGEPAASTVAKHLVRFHETDVNGVFTIEFGTGNYFSTNTSHLQSVNKRETDEIQAIHVYNINGEDGHYGLNFWTAEGTDGTRIDNNGSGAVLAPWGSGTIETTGGNNDHKIYAIEINEVSEREIAMAEAIATLQQYQSYTFTAGTTPGTYSQEAVDAFNAALEAASAIDGPDGDDLTVEDLRQIAQDIKDAYEAVLNTLVPYAQAIADGYYYINSAMTFTEVGESYEDPETGVPVEGEETHPIKGMYAEKNSSGILAAGWKTHADDATFLWKVTAKGDKAYEVKSMSTDGKFTNTVAVLSTESDSLIVFDYNQEGVYNLRLQADAERAYNYIHANYHGGGTGKGSNLVKWCQTDGTGASEWTLVPVDEATALQLIEAYAPIKNESERIANAKAMVDELNQKFLIAQDKVNLINTGNLTAPYTQADDGQGLPALVDNNPDTYWHSSWKSIEGHQMGDHYFQVALAEQIDEATFELTRRANQNSGHMTKLGIYGGNEANGEKSGYTLLLEWEIPNPVAGEKLVTDKFAVGAYDYIRVYIEGTDNDNLFSHAAEAALYSTKENTSSQAIGMGAVYTNAVAAVAAAEAEEKISVETYNALKEAYDAFNEIFVDPSALRAALSNVSGATDGIVIGDNPGEWKDNSSVASFNALVAEATAYDKAGKYTPAQSEKYIADLQNANTDFLAAANPIQEGKWYQFQFVSEELYDEQGWNKGNVAERTNEESGAVTSDALYNTYVAAGLETETGAETANEDEVALGHGLYFVDEMDGEGDDIAQFRFVAVGDTAYAIQNRATGLYLHSDGATGQVSLSVAPDLYKASAMGFGKVKLAAQSIQGTNHNFLHAQLIGAKLVTWDAEEVSSNTGFLIKEVEDVESYEATDFQMSLREGQIYNWCFPVKVSSEDATLYGVELDGTEVTITKLADNTAAAGEPFIIVVGDLADYDEEAEEENIAFIHENTFIREAKTVGKHVGVFEYTEIPAGNIVPKANAFALTTKSTTAVGANGTYIEAGIEDLDTEITTEVGEGTFDSIKETFAKAQKGGDIYTIDGKYVGKGNLSTKLGKGIYIINGVKVIVK